MTTVQTEEQIIEAIIDRHAPAVRHRARMEMRIVNALIERAAETGHRLHVRECEDDGMTDYDFRAEVFALDEANVTLEVLATGKRWGWILLVFGNDGPDLISDYTCSLDEFLAPINALSELMENGG